jgi:hypothetical protein
MKRFPSSLSARLAVAVRLLICGLAILVAVPAFAQEDVSINRYTLYTGFDYMTSPAMHLSQRGFDTDFGVTVKPWLGLGVDFSAAGDGIITGGGTINGSQTSYAPILGPVIPIPVSAIQVPFRSTTYTVAVGPQIYIRKIRNVTFLIRPGLGAIKASSDLRFPPLLAPVFGGLGVPAPAPHQSDTTWFIGLGGGFDINFSKHVALRVTADWINTHLYSNILTDRQNYGRFTIGPTWRWGRL